MGDVRPAGIGSRIGAKVCGAEVCAAMVGAAVAVALLSGGNAVAGQDDPRLDGLFAKLAGAENARDAAQIEGQIWEAWLEAGDATIDGWMQSGVHALNTGDLGSALHELDRIVASAPSYAEGWNKRATLYYMIGQLEASVADVERTLALEPRHFGALSGLALIREVQGRPFEALEALERVLALYPHFPHLKERVDHLTRQLGEPI